MQSYTAAIEKYKENADSVAGVVEKAGAFANLPAGAKVVIKPNIVFWTKVTDFPKWGVITTSRVMEAVVKLLRDHGAGEITIAEGIVTSKPNDRETPTHAFESLGYNKLKDRYGVQAVNVFDRPFETVELETGLTLNVNSDLVNADFVVNVPVMKTHVQTVVSLGMKNLKGTLDINSRKKCHSPDPDKNLDYMVSLIPNMLPPSATIIDGIYTLERGPAFDGKPRKSDLLVASADVLSADMVGARLLGQEPASVPYLAHAAARAVRPTDLSDITVIGEKVDDLAACHETTFVYNEANSMPVKLEKMGLQGIYYRKYDDTMCTYCSGLNGLMLTAIAMAWKGEPWDEVEILTGKKMQPTPGMNKTILVGKCMYQLHKDNPVIKEMIPIKGCPPNPRKAVEALHQAGIMVEPAIFENMEMGPAYFMARYKDRPEFDPSFFTID